MDQACHSYLDFFPRHSFGEVKVYLYNEIEDSEQETVFYLLDKSAEVSNEQPVFLIPKEIREAAFQLEHWRDLELSKIYISQGALVCGDVINDEKSIILKASKHIYGDNILISRWRRDGIRHVDFVERAVPIPEEHDGFHDYVRRWCERELNDQGYNVNRMEPEDYNRAFLKMGKPIRYHFFLSEETGNEPDCYFQNNRFVHPSGCPVFEDLLSDNLEFIGDDPFWGPVWQDPEYPREHSVWMLIERRDSRLLSVVTLIYDHGNISLMLVPYYFKLLI